VRKIFNGLLFILSLASSGIVHGGVCSCYGPTVENEHLYRIAMHVRPNASVSVQQTMLALLRTNPKAFNQNNINGLKSGYRLHVPSLETIQKISPEVALAKVAQQNKGWLKGERLKEPQPLAKHAKKRIASNSKHEALAKAPIKQEQTQQASTPQPVEAKSSVLELGQNQPATTNTAIPVVKEETVQSEQQKQFEQQTAAQITNLQQKTNQLQNTINILSEDIRTLTYRFIQMNAANSKKTMSYQDFLMDNLKKYGPVLGASLLGLILLLYLLKQTFRKKPARTESKKDEYDYMGSQDSIPTKLDLARAYIDMGDGVAAKHALNEVLAKGNVEQQQEARDLLDQLNHGHD
jgi:FimV-like protein